MEYWDYLEEWYRLVVLRYERAALKADEERENGEALSEQGEADRNETLLKAISEKENSLIRAEEEMRERGQAAPLVALFDAIGASGFERHTAAMLLFWELRPECADANRSLCGRSEVSPRLLRMTYSGFFSDDEAYLSLRGDSAFGRIFLEEQKEKGVDRSLFLSQRILRILLTGTPHTLPDENEKLSEGMAMVSSPIPRANRIECHFSLDDVVLPESSLEEIRLCCERVRFAGRVYGEWGLGRMAAYGKGVSMLFAGPPGTGKTMSAQAVAKELSMELYRINLPTVVSKYIGETERNLSEIFENAADRRVVLFFDEADALFGKRTEIKDSNDKYSNMEAAYLLQRMEEYEGVAILATNYRRNFDEAFNRRLTAIIDFPFPDAQSRRLIWKRSIPEEILPEGWDTDPLADCFELTGSAIKNSVLHAAFLAAAAGTDRLSEDYILEGIRKEYKKQGKIVSLEELREALER